MSRFVSIAMASLLPSFLSTYCARVTMRSSEDVTAEGSTSGKFKSYCARVTMRSSEDVTAEGSTSGKFKSIKLFKNNTEYDKFSNAPVTMTEASEFCVIAEHNKKDQPEHFGVVVKSTFQLPEGYTFKYLLAHALPEEGATKTKLIMLFADDFSILQESMCVSGVRAANGTWVRTCKPADVKPICEWGTSSLTATADRLLNICRQRVEKPFFYEGTAQTTGEMAAGNLGNRTNCIETALSLEAVLLGRDPKVYVEEIFDSQRGEMLRQAGKGIADFADGVPCTNKFFWTTKCKKSITSYGRTLESGELWMQVHRLSNDALPPGPLGQFVSQTSKTVRAAAKWSVGNEAFRVIYVPSDPSQQCMRVLRLDDCEEQISRWFNQAGVVPQAAGE